MKNTIVVVLTFLLLIPLCMVVCANPQVSFTSISIENKTVLKPTLNCDVTHYKWSIIGKRDAYNLETGWIPYCDRGNHISMLESGTYLVTLTGRNTNTGLSDTFTNQIKVRVTEDYVEPEPLSQDTGDIGSRIINSLPQPLKTFLQQRSQLELLLIVIAILLFLGFLTRRKKLRRIIKVEKIK